MTKNIKEYLIIFAFLSIPIAYVLLIFIYMRFYQWKNAVESRVYLHLTNYLYMIQ